MSWLCGSVVHLSCMHASSISWTSRLLSTTCPPLSAKNPVMQISLDGYWSGYLARNRSYFLRSLASTGVRAEYLRSQYPTKTFPNHFSIVTVSCMHAVVCVTVCVASWMCPHVSADIHLPCSQCPSHASHMTMQCAQLWQI